MDGAVAIVGARGDDDAGLDAGAAYLFRFDGTSWVEEQKVVPGFAVDGDQMGYSVSLSGDVAVVGGWNFSSTYMGVGVYRFDGTTWIEEAVLEGSMQDPVEAFGRAVAIDGEVIVLGSPWGEGLVWRSGRAYVYRYDGTTWVEEATLAGSTAGFGAVFGWDVGVSGDRIIVGAPGHDGTGADYLYEYDGTSWNETQQMTSSAAATDHRFGHSVDIDGGRAVVGKWGPPTDVGAATVLALDGAIWEEVQILEPGDPSADSHFGHRVAIDGTRVTVGAHFDDSPAVDAGAAYLFDHVSGVWTEVAKLVASDQQPGNHLGIGVASSGSRVIVGAHDTGDLGISSGSIYTYDLVVGGVQFRRGDANGDGGFDVADAVFSLAALFVSGASPPSCTAAADSNTDGLFDISDAIYTLTSLFVPGSPPPSAPYPDCGVDPALAGLSCLDYPCP